MVNTYSDTSKTPPAAEMRDAQLASSSEAGADLQFAEDGQHVNTTVQADPADIPEVAPSVPPNAVRQKRGADPARDDIWTRHHALCMMGLICDTTLGGYDEARAARSPLKEGVRIPSVISMLEGICPWLINPCYLNFDGSVMLNDHDVYRCFDSWAANRIYYFYREACQEHPANRRRSNIGRIYRRFYDAFQPYVTAERAVSEATARQFWLSVADEVPFHSPVSGEFAFVPEGRTVILPVQNVVTGAAVATETRFANPSHDE